MKQPLVKKTEMFWLCLWVVISRSDWSMQHLCSSADIADVQRAGTLSQLAIFFSFIFLKRAEAAWQPAVVLPQDAPPAPTQHLYRPLLQTIRKFRGDEDSCSSGGRQVWNNLKMKVYPCVSKSPALHVGEILTDLVEQRQHGNKPTSHTAPESR